MQIKVVKVGEAMGGWEVREMPEGGRTEILMSGCAEGRGGGVRLSLVLS